MGNVLVTLSDMLVGIDSSGGDTTAIYYTATVLNASSFYPFGWEIAARSYHSSLEYKHGFNGKINDKDAGAYDFGARMYNSQLGRWWSVDPLSGKYPHISPFTYVADNPLYYVDVNGEDLIIYGSVAQFNKVKAILEQEFGGAIRVVRDAENRVHLLYNKTGKPVSKQTLRNVVQYNMLPQEVAFTELARIIVDDKDTKIRLLTNHPIVATGAFRSEKREPNVSEMNEKIQFIDIEDVVHQDNQNPITGSSITALMHELVEAFQDQVVNNSPKVTNLQEFDDVFLNPNFSFF